MALATAQFTIIDFNDVNISTTQPSAPVYNQLWLDTSVTPNQLKRWDNSTWVVVNEVVVGSRNYAKGTATVKSITGTNISNQAISAYNIDCTNLLGKQVTVSFNWRATTATPTGTIRLQTGASHWQGITDNVDVTALSGRVVKTVNIYNSGGKTFSNIELRGDYLNGTIEISNVKIELGNQATDWTIAPEDTEGRVSGLETRVTSAEQKITPTAIVSTVTTSTQYVNDLGAKLNKSDLSTKIQQSSTDVKIAVGQVGGNNLIKNSTFRFNLDNWGNISTGVTATTGFDTIIADNYITLTNTNSTQAFIFQSTFNIMPETQYTLSGWYYSTATTGGDVFILGQKSATTSYNFDYIHGSGTLATLNKWIKFSVTFTTAVDEIKSIVRLDHNGGSGTVRYSQLKLELGANATSWSAHAGEVSNALSTFNDSGLTISHSKVGTKTVMSADGFKILNGLGEEIGSLATQSGLTQLTADTITANNIYTVDFANRSFYVNGTTGLDTNAGTSASPFRTVKQALNTLAGFGRVRSAEAKGIIYVYGTVTEDIYVRNFTGGVVELRFDKTCTVNGKISVEYCTAQVNLYGGRTMSTDTSGCLINNKDTNTTAINISYSNTIYLHGFRITNKGGHGIQFLASNGFVQWCDINYCNASGMACIKASYNASVGVHDCTGSNNGISLYADYGSVINIGQQGNATAVTYPNSTSTNYGAYGGYIYALSTINKLNSAYTPSAITTQMYTTYYSTKNTQSWRDNWGWRTDNSYIYQGQYGGNGNHRGFMTFDSATIRSNLSGSTIQDIQLRLVRRNSGGSSSAQPVYLYGHKYDTTGGDYDLPTYYGQIGSWAWGEDKWVTLPISVGNDLKAGNINGLGIYDSSGSSYVTFDIAQLWIKYEK